MKNAVAVLVVVSGIAATASAQSASMTLKVRNAGDAAWSSSVNLASGVVECAMFIGFDFPGAVGLAGAVYNIQGLGITNDTVDIASAGLDRQSTFNFGASNRAIFMTGNSFRIDDATDAANSVDLGISSSQNTPSALGAAFNGSNPALVYRFNITVGGGANHVIDLTAPLAQLKRSLIGIYSSAGASRSTSITTGLTTTGATINVQVPAPASLAMVGLGGLLASRRRTR